MLVAARREPEAFSSADCEFLRQLSEHVALAAHQAQIYGALQQAYDDLRQSQQAVLQQSACARSAQMASGIAHDINNAISPVALYTQLLLESEPNLSPRGARVPGDDRARHRGRGGDRRAHARVLPAARAAGAARADGAEQAGAAGPAPHPGPLERHAAAARRRGHCGTELAPDLPLIMAAESEIREALTNLVFNAVDAMPEGGTLTIRTRVTGTEPAAADDPTCASCTSR